jgi:hypothetical protein
MFVSFGDIVDVTIKKAIVINVSRDPTLYVSCYYCYFFQTASIKGFGFVHFRDDPAGMRSAVTSANALANFILHDVSYQCTISRELEQRIKAEGYVHDQDPAAASMGFNNVLSTMGGSQEAYRPPQQQTHIQQQHYQQQYQQNQHPSHQQQHAQYPPVPFQSQHSQAHQQQYPDQRYSAHHPPHGSEYGQRDYPMVPRVVSPLPFMPSTASGRYPHLMGGYSEPPSSFAPQVHAMHQQPYEHLGGAKDYHSHHAALSHQPQHQQPPMAQYSPYHAASQPGHAQMPPPPGPVQHAYPPPPQAEFQRPNFPAHIHIPSQATLGFHQHSLPYGQGAPSFSPGSTGGGNTSSSTVSPLSQDGSGHGMGVSPVSAYHAVVHQQQQQTHHQYPRPIVHQQNYNTNINNSNGQLQQHQQQQSGPAPLAPLSTAEALSQALQTGRDLKPPSVLYANLHYKGLQAAKRGDGEN